MAYRRAFKRRTVNQTAHRNVAMIEALAGREIPELRRGLDENFPLRKRRAQALDIDAVHRKQAYPDDNEASVIRAVSDLLAAHPSVLLAVRQNSGAMPYDRDGRPVPVFFYKLLRTPEDMTIVDFWGFLRDGKPFAIECKRPSWKGPSASNDREMKQSAFIRMIECIGGKGGFARSVEEAQAIL